MTTVLSGVRSGRAEIPDPRCLLRAGLGREENPKGSSAIRIRELNNRQCVNHLHRGVWGVTGFFLIRGQILRRKLERSGPGVHVEVMDIGDVDDAFGKQGGDPASVESAFLSGILGVSITLGFNVPMGQENL